MYYIILYYIYIYYIIYNDIILYYIIFVFILYYTILYYIILYYIILYCIIFCYINIYTLKNKSPCEISGTWSGHDGHHRHVLPSALMKDPKDGRISSVWGWLSTWENHGLSSGDIKYHPQTYGYNWNLNVQQPSSNTFQFFDFVERCFFSRNHDAFHMKGLPIVRLRSTSWLWNILTWEHQ